MLSNFKCPFSEDADSTESKVILEALISFLIHAFSLEMAKKCNR